LTQPAEPAERSAALLERFSHEPLRARVAEALRAAIFDGTLAPGTPLVEKAIAADLDISRAPVREAIRMLSQEGLVESVAYKGSSVRRPTSRDVTEVYSLRGLLERFAVRKLGASLAANPDRLAALATVCDDMEACAARNDIKGLSAADERFHRTLIELADHQLLAEMWSLIALRVRHIMGLRNAQLRDYRRVVANHRAIVEALASADLDRALGLLTDHIDAGAQLVLDDWLEAPR
jgi:DNA-binding GntR family transcriptional regulator